MEETTKYIKDDLCGTKMNNAIVYCDIDGVLADYTHRLPYLEKKNYDKFYGASMADDEPCGMVTVSAISLLYGLAEIYDDVRVGVLTGRPESTASLTKMWLRYNFPYIFDKWIHADNDLVKCRANGDHRPAAEVKLDNVVADFKKEVIPRYGGDKGKASMYDFYFIDDDPEVISYMRDNFTDRMEKEFGVEVYCNAILISPGWLSNCSSQNKSSEE